jgi:hypothetical protein
MNYPNHTEATENDTGDHDLVNNDHENNMIVNKIDLITKSQKPYIRRILLDIFDNLPENAGNICEFIIAERNEIDIKESTVEWHIKVFGQIQKYLNYKDFNDITKDNVLNFLNSLRKILEEDPNSKGIIQIYQNKPYCN